MATKWAERPTATPRTGWEHFRATAEQRPELSNPSSITGEARALTDFRTIKRLFAAAGGMFGAHALAHLKFIPGGNAGMIGIAKLAGATVLETWLVDKFMPAYAEPVLEGGGLLTVLEIIGFATHGRLGAIPVDGADMAQITKTDTPAAQLAAAQSQNTQVASNLRTAVPEVSGGDSWTESGV